MANIGITENILDKIENVGVILRPSTPELKKYFFELKTFFEKYGINVAIDNISGNMIGVFGREFNSMCKESDILVSVGGDGTLISVVRRSFMFNKPILGINMGNLGFLTDIRKDKVEDFIRKLLEGDYRIDNRMLVRTRIIKANGEEIEAYAFNDVVITRKHLTRMVHVKASIEKEPFNTYYGDGLIVATPTGSTAYNISAGGPVVYPFSQIFIITPICAHSLTQRPLVLPAEFEIDLEIADSESAIIVFDGQEMIDFEPGDVVKITMSETYAKLIHRKERNYFKVLKEKFNWGDM